MFEKRTDLALEVHELRGEESGITVREEIKRGFKVIYAEISDPDGEKASGKPAGKYITLETGELWRKTSADFATAANLLAEEITSLLPDGDGCVLAAGLGNEDITPDSLGPRAVKEMLVTRHIQTVDPSLYTDVGFGCLAAVSPGVLGQTGIESADIIASISQKIKPKCVLLIDSLASRRLNRLAATVQLSNAGINPGSGVSNKRVRLDASLLGAPVISIGVPTVVDAATLAYDLLEEHNGGEDPQFEAVLEKLFLGSGRDMFVTPKENDVIAKHTAKLIAAAVNIAVHGMTVSEINEFKS